MIHDNILGNIYNKKLFLGPALVISVVSLLANVLLIGGSRQLSKDFLLVWIVWKSIGKKYVIKI